MNAMERHSRRRHQEEEVRVALPQMLDRLAGLPHVQQLQFSAEQVLLYEGHIAPGMFVFWEGQLALQSVLFQEQRTVCLYPASGPTIEDAPASGGGVEVGRADVAPIDAWWVFPERHQLPIALPFTVSTMQVTRALFLPRSLLQDPMTCEILQAL